MLQIPNDKLYLHFDGQNQGPFDIAEVRKLFKFQIINRATPMWYEGLRNWIAVGDIPEFNRRSVPIAPALPKTSPAKKSEFWVYYSGSVTSLSLPQIQELIATQKLRRSDYIYQAETNEWVRGDQHTVTFKLFASPPTLENTPGINRTSLKTIPTEDPSLPAGEPPLTFVERMVLTLQENLFLDVLVLFLVTIGILAYLFWPKPSHLDAPTLSEYGDPVLETPEEPGPNRAQSRDHSLLGFDMSLRLSEFKIRYAKQIARCRDDRFAPKGAAQNPEIVVCELREGGTVRFFEHQIYDFSKTIAESTVPLRKAAEQLQEKTGYKTTVETFTDGNAIYCGSSVPFHEGQAIVQSEDVAQKIIQLYGGDRNTCDQKIFQESNLRTVKYKNTQVRTRLEAAAQGKALRENANEDGEFEL